MPDRSDRSSRPGSARSRTSGPARRRAATGRPSGSTRSAASRSGSRPGRKATDRPASVRRTAAQPTRSTASGASRATRRPGGITGRALLLGGLVIAVVLLLILPVSNYLHQKSEIDALQQQIAAKKTSISELNDRNTLLDDPAYIASQARERLNYIMPGEKVYVVSDNGPSSATAKDKKKSQEQKQKAKGSALGNLSDAISKADQGK